MKIAVGIPSFMESQNIEFVTRHIDKGLCILKNKYPAIKECVIINVDSNSKDGTRKIFKRTNTFFPKISINILGARGKGKNLLAFFKKANSKI